MMISAVLMLLSTSTAAKTLVVYYSYTNNCRSIVNTLTSQMEAEVLEIQPAEKGLRYEANGYELGTKLLNAIKNDPDNAASYPAIDPVTTELNDYQNIIVVTPLWWSKMAAIMQTYLFHYGPQMGGKTIALIVSSASSGISGVVADCKRLVPDATWAGDALWINNDNRNQTASLLKEWLAKQNFQTSTEMEKMYITIGGQTQSATLADNQATKELVEKLKGGPLTVTLKSNRSFEIWGPLGFALTTNDQQMAAQPGDIVLYDGNNICLFYGSNSWAYTRLGRIDGLSATELKSFLNADESTVAVTLSLTPGSTDVKKVSATNAQGDCYSLSGQRMERTTHGIYIKDGKKTIL